MRLPTSFAPSALALSLATGLALPAMAQDAPDQGELTKKLANPISNLISVPLIYNRDNSDTTGTRETLNIQPVIPFSISEDYNLITRTIFPLISTDKPAPASGTVSGLGDTVQSFFFSPKAPTSSGWIVGAGPVFLWPTATQNALGAQKWGIGPTTVALKQENGFTYGMLANHIWSYAGKGDRDISATFLQPFLSYGFKTYTTLGISTESTYDWKSSQWTVPIIVNVSQVLKIGGQPISLSAGYKHYATRPTGGPDDGIRLGLTLLFPK